jgi:hypothetical protein
MDRNCPFCGRTLDETDNTADTQQYVCKSWAKDHAYAEGFKNGEIFRLKIRLKDDLSEVFLHVHMGEDYSEVWTRAGDIGGRVRINKAIVTDFANREVLMNKLRTYLILS